MNERLPVKLFLVFLRFDLKVESASQINCAGIMREESDN